MTKFKSMMLGLAMGTVLAGAGLWPVASHAALINTLFVSGTNQIQDSDVERVLRADDQGSVMLGGDSYSVVTTGAFQTGDILQSILRFDTANAGSIGDSLPAPYQLTGYSLLQINSVADAGGGFQNLVFGPTGYLTNNSMADLYERTSAAQPGYSAGADPATGISNILGQTLIAQLGLNGIDDFWVSTSPSIDAVQVATQGSGQAAAGVFGLSVLNNPGGLPIVTNGIQSPIDLNFHDVVGDASIYAAEIGVNDGWIVSSNINAAFTVPEPGTLALVGLALFGIGAVARRRMTI